MDNRVDPSRRPARTVGLARRGRQDRRNRDHIKGLRSAAGRFGRFVARVARRLTTAVRPGPRPTGRDRHPGVDTSVGPTKPAGLGRRPLDAFLEARMSADRPRSTPARARSPRRPAGAPRRARGGRPRPHRPRARGRDRAGVGAGRARRRPRGRGRDPVRRAARLAGGDRARATSAGCCSGRLGGRTVVMLQGRFHLYEGNDPGLVVQPVLLFRALGARIVVLTNAAGGLDPAFGPGTLMVIRDHLNLTGQNPLLGPNADEIGPRFPDLTDAWSPRLRERLHAAGAAEGVDLEEGIYVGLTRPELRDPGRGPDVRGARRPRGRHVDGPRVHRGALGRPGGLRRLARHERRRGLHRRAADPRGGPRGGRRGRPAPRPRHPPVRRGAAPREG